jgi:hypothetical protein
MNFLERIAVLSETALGTSAFRIAYVLGACGGAFAFYLKLRDLGL